MSKELDKAREVEVTGSEDIEYLKRLMLSCKACELDKFIKLIDDAEDKLKSRKKSKAKKPKQSEADSLESENPDE